ARPRGGGGDCGGTARGTRAHRRAGQGRRARALPPAARRSRRSAASARVLATRRRQLRARPGAGHQRRRAARPRPAAARGSVADVLTASPIRGSPGPCPADKIPLSAGWRACRRHVAFGQSLLSPVTRDRPEDGSAEGPMLGYTRRLTAPLQEHIDRAINDVMISLPDPERLTPEERRGIIARYAAVLEGNFIYWMTAAHLAVASDEAKAIIEDNLLEEVRDNHPGMLRRFVIAAHAVPTDSDALAVYRHLESVRPLIETVIRPAGAVTPRLAVEAAAAGPRIIHEIESAPAAA